MGGIYISQLSGIELWMGLKDSPQKISLFPGPSPLELLILPVTAADTNRKAAYLFMSKLQLR